MSGAKKGDGTKFKGGKENPNYLALGSERKRHGYIQVKTINLEGQEVWIPKHRYLYEKHYGPIPKGSAVVFGDGDSTNFDLDNLILVTKGQLAFMNRYGLRSDNADITRSGAICAELMLRIARAKKDFGNGKER